MSVPYIDWPSEKESVKAFAIMWAQRDECRRVLRLAKEKLKIYRKHSSGEYQGGCEYRNLIDQINVALGEG